LKKGIQTAICCPCGNEKILALGRCATCYTLAPIADKGVSRQRSLMTRKLNSVQ